MINNLEKKPSGIDYWHPELDQSRLEAIQFLAFALMVINHVGLFLLDDNQLLRGIGRLSFPLFALVFSWRLSIMMESNPQRSMYSNFVRMIFVGLIAQWLFFNMEYNAYALNIMFLFSLCLFVILLCIDEREFFGIKIAHRFVIAAFTLYFFSERVDYDYGGVFLILGLFSYFRWREYYGLFAALVGIATMSSAFDPPVVFLSIPVAFFILKLKPGKFNMNKIHPMFFYWAYPAHILVIGVVAAVIASASA